MRPPASRLRPAARASSSPREPLRTSRDVDAAALAASRGDRLRATASAPTRERARRRAAPSTRDAALIGVVSRGGVSSAIEALAASRAPCSVVVEHQRGRQAQVAEAVHRLERERCRRRVVSCSSTAEALLRVRAQRSRAHAPGRPRRGRSAARAGRAARCGSGGRSVTTPCTSARDRLSALRRCAAAPPAECSRARPARRAAAAAARRAGRGGARSRRRPPG